MKKMKSDQIQIISYIYIYNQFIVCFVIGLEFLFISRVNEEYWSRVFTTVGTSWLQPESVLLLYYFVRSIMNYSTVFSQLYFNRSYL